MKISRTDRLLFIFLMFVLPALISVGTASSAENEIKKLKVGVIVPLTGPLAFFGQDYVRTYELATEDIPELKNAFDVVFEDSAYDSKQAVSALNKLVSSDRVDIIFSFGGPMLSALAPIAEVKKIPFFATESEKRDCEGKKYCTLVRNEKDEWGKATWQMLRKHGKAKIGIIKNQNQFMNTFVDGVVDNKASSEQVTILSDIPPSTVDLKTEVSALKTADFDALGIYLLPGSHHGLLKALKDLKKKQFLFGVEEFLVPENNKGFEEVIDGVFVVAPAYVDDYRIRFENKYGFSAGFYYTPAFYDFLVLLKDTLHTRKDLRGLPLIDGLRFEGDRTGVSGKFSVKRSPKGVYSFSFPIGVYRVENNKIAVDETIHF